MNTKLNTKLCDMLTKTRFFISLIQPHVIDRIGSFNAIMPFKLVYWKSKETPIPFSVELTHKANYVSSYVSFDPLMLSFMEAEEDWTSELANKYRKVSKYFNAHPMVILFKDKLKQVINQLISQGLEKLKIYYYSNDIIEIQVRVTREDITEIYGYTEENLWARIDYDKCWMIAWTDGYNICIDYANKLITYLIHYFKATLPVAKIYKQI